MNGSDCKILDTEHTLEDNMESMSWFKFFSTADNKFKSRLNHTSRKKAREELNEIESDRASAVQTFRRWVLDQKDWLTAPTGKILYIHRKTKK